MLDRIYKHGEFGEAEANEAAKELCELYKSRGFKAIATGWLWEDTEPAFKTTCMCYDMKAHNLDDNGNFILVVLVEYKRAPLTEHGLMAKYTVELPISELENFFERNDIDIYEYSDENFLTREAMCDLTGYCKGTSCKYWSKCKD